MGKICSVPSAPRTRFKHAKNQITESRPQPTPIKLGRKALHLSLCNHRFSRRLQFQIKDMHALETILREQHSLQTKGTVVWGRPTLRIASVAKDKWEQNNRDKNKHAPIQSKSSAPNYQAQYRYRLLVYIYIIVLA